MPSHDSKPAGGIEFYGGYQVYSDSGVDLTLLRENLKRTIEERLADNARAHGWPMRWRKPAEGCANQPQPMKGDGS